MSEVTRHSIALRLGSALMRKMNEIVEGYDPIFLADMIDLLGPRGVGAWGAKLQEMSDSLRAEFGDAESQLLISFAAMFNGCRVCSVGHMYVANLHHFDETGEVLPIDEREVYDLQNLSDEELLALVARRLEDPRYEKVVQLVNRMHALKYRGESPQNREDNLLAGAIAAWDLLTECTILSDVSDPAEVGPLTSIGKRKDLMAAYQKARGRRVGG